MDIFAKPEEGTPAPSIEVSPEVATELATKLTDIKNEKGEAKYGDLNTALDALKESQAYIPTLKEELAAAKAEAEALKAQVATSSNLEETVQKLLEDRQEPVQNADQQQAPSLDETKVAEMFDQMLDNRTKQQVAAANGEKVSNALKNAFGDRAKDVVEAKATEMGVTPERLGQLATESPEMVLNLFKETKVTPPTTPSTVNSNQFQSHEDNELKQPDKSMLAGASSKEQAAYMQQIKDHIYKKYEVES